MLLAAGPSQSGSRTDLAGRSRHAESRPHAPAFVLRPALAILKSCEIVLRGVPVWMVAAEAAWSATLDDVAAAQRSRMSCRSLASLFALERDLTLRTHAAALSRQCLLLRIVLQLCDEAADPPQRLVGFAFDVVHRAERPARP